MQLDTEFIRLPLRADAARLAREVARIPEAAWRPHPQGYPGNSALALISAGGDPNSDDVAGPMRPTPHLSQLPYLTQVLHALGTVIGRTRLMRLEGNAEAISHNDVNYYWFDRARVHVPIVTHPDVIFSCGAASQHMAAGETWVFNTWQQHRVTNPRPTSRIHLVADTVGSAAFWALVDAGDRVFASDRRAPAPDREIAFESDGAAELNCETWNWPPVMAPAQLEAVVAQIRGTLPAGNPAFAALDRALVTFAREWRSLWARYADGADGIAEYRAVRARFGAECDALSAGLELANGGDAQRTLRELLVRPALADRTSVGGPAPALRGGAMPAKQAAARSTRFDRPIFIVCPPRSGSSLLFETLSQSPDLWSVGGESHRLIEGIPELHPAHRGFESNRITREAANDATVERLHSALWQQLRNRDHEAPGIDAPPRSAGAVPSIDAPPRSAGAVLSIDTRVRLLEKTPKNSLRVPFLAAAFPDALFVYLYRDPRETLSSMLDAWRSGRFVTYPELPGWQGPPWSLLLTPGWRELAGRPLHEIVAHQWTTATDLVLDDLEALPPDAWCIASYDRLVADAQSEIERICRFVQVGWDRALDAPLPHSRTTLTSPDPEKWRRNASELDAMMPIVRDVAARARLLFGTPPATQAARRAPAASKPPVTHSPVPTPAATAQQPAMDFRSVYTQSFPQLLRQLAATLVVTTYQSGRVILVRADGDKLNTHLRSFSSPMGVAVAPGRLALGTEREIWEFFDMPAVAAKLDRPHRHDAVYVPRACSVTGDIRVHELAYAGGELWIANTRFSALCTLDHEHSFVPRWRPPFVSALAPEDRCHLNGMCVVDDQIRYVTALGASDAAGGWRETKAAGGCVLEVPSGRVVASGLSMPHSPRWHDGALWVLESGKGEIGTVDFESQRVTPRAQLDGFTRGLAFAGPYAFVGLSQVRESNVFGGIPLVERVNERKCGVWVIDTRSGKVAAFLRFEGTVQEIFDVQVLPGARFAELLEPGTDLLSTTYALPPEALAEIPSHLKHSPR